MMIGSQRGDDWETKKQRKMERENGREEFLADSMFNLHGEYPTLKDVIDEGSHEKVQKAGKKFFEFR